MNRCKICGKPGAYPNFIISKGHAMHVGCMADSWHELLQSLNDMLDKHSDHANEIHQSALAAIAKAKGTK